MNTLCEDCGTPHYCAQNAIECCPAPAVMLARQNDYGVSVNESAVCVRCTDDSQALEASYRHWVDAEDVTRPQAQNSDLYPVDNPDARCNGCGAPTLLPLGKALA